MQTKKVPRNFVEKSQGVRSRFGRNFVQGRKLKLFLLLFREFLAMIGDAGNIEKAAKNTSTFSF